MTSLRLPKRREPALNPNRHLLPELVQLWLLRMLVLLDGCNCMRSSISYELQNIGPALGLGQALKAEMPEGEVQAHVQKQLVERLKVVEEQAKNARPPEVLTRNVQRVADLIGLNLIEVRIIEFSVMVKANHQLKMGAESLGNQDKSQLTHAISTVLDLPVPDIREALHPQARLAQSGLLTISSGYSDTLDNKLNLLSDSLHEKLMDDDVQPESWLQHMIYKTEPSNLHLDDYASVSKTLDVLRPYLRQAVQTSATGVNVFLYGPPGTGKTQLAKLLAQDCGSELFEVSSEDEDGDAVNGPRRIKALNAANSLLKQRKVMMLFDEVEDVFNSGDISLLFSRVRKFTNKGHINRLLETNALVTIWVSNTESVDPAFVRRFDVVLELSVPPKAQRQRIIETNCQGLLPMPAVSRMAESEKLSPAVVARASKVIRSISSQIDADTAASSLELLINHTLLAQGHAAVVRHNATRLPEFYDPAYINTKEDLQAITRQLINHKSARLCLYGPPGTGKTAFGRWLADQLQLPIQARRASDLFGMYVGESEKRIARAFARAQEEGALLLIDEMDSFLQSRQVARNSWEVSHVNEMLTQIEAFSGVLIASTNLMDTLDAAALRRFDLKLSFDYLRSEQAEQLLCRSCSQLGLAQPNTSDIAQLRYLNQLTPGDFATVMRQHGLRPLQSPSHVVAALAEECAVKPHAKRLVGFVS